MNLWKSLETLSEDTTHTRKDKMSNVHRFSELIVISTLFVLAMVINRNILQEERVDTLKPKNLKSGLLFEKSIFL